jgi:hypothetical protein
MTQKEASIILNVSVSYIRDFIKQKSIKVDIVNKIIDESVYELKKDLEERRSITKPVWIERNDY